MARGIRRLRGATLAMAVICLAAAAPASAKLGVTWMKGYAAPGTPAKYNKVGVIKVGSRHARNVLVLEPGTSAGAGYFVPLAQWIVVPRARLAGVVGGAPREPARGPVRAQPGQGAQGHGHPDVQLLPGLPGRSQHHPAHPPGPRLGGAVRAPVGSEGRRRGPARRHRRRPQARRAAWCSAATRWAARWSPPTPPGTSAASPAPTSCAGLVYDDGGSSSQVVSALRRAQRARHAGHEHAVAGLLRRPGAGAGTVLRRRLDRRAHRAQRAVELAVVLAHAVGAQAAGAGHQPGHVRLRHRRQDVQAGVRRPGPPRPAQYQREPGGLVERRGDHADRPLGQHARRRRA